MVYITTLLIPFSFLGFLLIPGVGEIIGLVASVAVLFFFFAWGDKIILTLSNAFLLKGKASLRQTISNQTCLLGIDSVELYITHKHPNNIYFIGSFFEKSIIIGRSIFDKLEKKEVNSLVTFGIHKIKALDIQYASMAVLCFAVFFLPIFIFKTLKNINFLRLGYFYSVLSEVLMFFYMPAFAINQFFMAKLMNHEEFDRNFCDKTHLNHSYSSALFKIETMRTEANLTGSGFVLNQLSVMPDVNLEIIREINYLKNPFALRYKKINSKRSIK